MKAMGILISLLMVLFGLSACNGGETNASAYKKEYLAASTPSSDDAQGSADNEADDGLSEDEDEDAASEDGGGLDPALVARGTEVYNASCAGCHENAVASPLLGTGSYTADQVIAAGNDIASHAQLIATFEAEAEALAAAFTRP